MTSSTAHTRLRGSDERRFFFNPLQVAVCGYSNSGKTTLIERLLPHFSDFRVGYAKNAHAFQMDRDGKDSARIRAAGAADVLVSTPGGHALISSEPLPEQDLPDLMIEDDLVVVEGFKDSPIPKLLVLDEPGKMLAKIGAGAFQPVIGCVGPGARPSALADDIAYLQRDQITEIAALLLAYLRAQCEQRPMCGLVLVGGQSERMGRDKAALRYSDGPEQAEKCAAMLQQYCPEVFISTRPGQEIGAAVGFERLPDTFVGYGPVGGILSALKARPEAAWLVLACDLPFATEATLGALLAGRNPFKACTAFRGPRDEAPEPLVAIYEPKSVFSLLQLLARGCHSPRRMMSNTRIELLTPADVKWLRNINRPEEYEEARRQLESQ